MTSSGGSDCELYGSEGMQSTTSQHSNSTPFKSNSRPGHTYTRLNTADERSLIKPPSEDPNFITTFFTPFDVPNVEGMDSSIQELLQVVYSASEECDMYDPLTSLLNNLSDRLSTNLKETGYSSFLHFVSSYKTSPAGKGHQYTRRLAPDLLVVPPKSHLEKFLPKEITKIDDENKLFPRCPWPLLESMVEVKDKKDRDHHQCLDYLETILQHRPDKSRVLGLGCNQNFYQFYYTDACTASCSIPFFWRDGLRNLFHFIYTLNYSCAKDIGRDTSMELHALHWQGIHAIPSWHFINTEKYEMQPIFERKGRGRRTWLGIGTECHSSGNGKPSESNIRIVKDMWQDNSRRFEEGDLLDRIHEKGFVSGVVRHVFAGPVNDLTIGNRSKRRLILGSTGLRLSACQSVLEFLKVMYDAVETHEQVMNRGVLHRDISWFNVLCKPQHYVDGPTIAMPTIGKIMGDQDEGSACLLTDFDNASLLSTETDPRANTERTGTPMFMALELAYGKPGYELLWAEEKPPITLDQFLLEGEALTRYIKVYGQEKYDSFNTSISSVISQAVEETPSFPSDSVIPHYPHHDIESIWWIILWFLLRSNPVSPAKEQHRVQLSEHVAEILLGRRLNGICDDIVSLLSRSAKSWKVILHPAYQSLTRMLADMGQYICMRWSRFPEMPIWHAHEAFKRLLLREILRLTNEGTPLPVQGPLPRLSRAAKGVGAVNPYASRTKYSSVGTSPRNSDLSEQPGRERKRSRSNSNGTNGESVAKKLRLITRSNKDNDVVIENIKSDDKWFL